MQYLNLYGDCGNTTRDCKILSWLFAFYCVMSSKKKMEKKSDPMAGVDDDRLIVKELKNLYAGIVVVSFLVIFPIDSINIGVPCRQVVGN